MKQHQSLLLHFAAAMQTNEVQDPSLLLQSRRGSGGSERSFRATAGLLGRRDREGCHNGKKSFVASTAAATAVALSFVETLQEMVKLAQTAAAVELAGRVESPRLSLVNDDPNPPELQVVKNVGERVLLTGVQF